MLDRIIAAKRSEVAERRRVADLVALEELARQAPRPPRSFADALVAPGMRVVAEVKRRSPSAGELAPVDTDAVELARAYAGAGAAAISVLTDEEFFGGSLDDLAAVAAAVDVPVLRKDFVLDRIQLLEARIAGAAAVLLIAGVLDTPQLRSLIAAAEALELDALVEVHDEADLAIALNAGARIIGINNRNLDTFEVDIATSEDLVQLVPADRIVVAESGIGGADDVRRLSRAGIRRVLVGSALVTSDDPASAVAAITAVRPRTVVKLCGLRTIDDARAAVDAGADEIGVILGRGKRQVSVEQARAIGDVVRAQAARTHTMPPEVVGVFVDETPDEVRDMAMRAGLDRIQLAGSACDREPDAAFPLPVTRTLHVGARTDPAEIRARAQEAAFPLLVDAQGAGDEAGGTGTPINLGVVASAGVAVHLAGGLTPETVAGAIRACRPLGVDVSSGIEGADGRKDPARMRAFVGAVRAVDDELQEGDAAHARQERAASSATAPRPASDQWLVDERGRFATGFGGSYVPEVLVPAVQQLVAAYEDASRDPAFLGEYRELLTRYVGRPTPLQHAARLTAHAGGARIHLKREDLNHTGAHKINNAIGQVLLARRMGKTRIIAETGAGQHGVATATACALLGLDCIVYMGEEDIARQQPNVFRMQLLGAEVRPVTDGTRTLKDAVNAAIKDWVTNVGDTFYVIGSAVGMHPYPTMVRDFQRVIGDEVREQAAAHDDVGRIDAIVACVGGGSNAIGIFHPFLDDASVRLVGAEAGGHGVDTGEHAATIVAGSEGVLHGARSYMLQSADGQVIGTHSISAGLDYPGVGPEHAHLRASGRAEYHAVTDEEALEAVRVLCRTEGIIPALESAHAIALGVRIARELGEGRSVVINLSGRGDKDLSTLIERLGDGT